MRKATRWPLLALLAAVLLTSCILIQDPEGEPGWRTIPDKGEEPAEERPAEDQQVGPGFRDTVEFAPGGTLSLENDFGNVEIIGWDMESVEIVARSAAAGGARQRSAREYGDRGRAPQVEVKETRDGLLVRTPPFEGPGRPPEVNFELHVPNSVVLTGIRVSEGNLAVSDVFGRLEVSVDQGDLSVSNYSGRVRAAVGTGDADVEVLDLRDGDEITITSRRGNIALRLESGVGAIIEADAPRGEVNSDFDLGRKLPAATVKGWIGQGGPAVILKASDGRIDIIRIADRPPAAPAAKGK
jgi:hypothetical protein